MSCGKGGHVRMATAKEINAARQVARAILKRSGINVAGPGYGQQWYPAGESPQREGAIEHLLAVTAFQATPL